MTMIKNKDHIHTEVRETMEAFDNLPELKAHYLFRARVMERISHEVLTHARETNSATHGLKLALMAFLLIMNIGSALVLMLSNGSEQTFTKQETIESLTNEYSSPALSYYLDNDNIEESGE